MMPSTPQPRLLLPFALEGETGVMQCAGETLTRDREREEEERKRKKRERMGLHKRV